MSGKYVFIGSSLSGSNPVTVGSLPELRSVAAVEGGVVIVSGAIFPGDGAGGIYYYDASDTTSADNGGTIIVGANGARWKILPVGFFKVGDPGLFGYVDNTLFQIYRTVATPTNIEQSMRSIVSGKGDNTTFIGTVAGYFEARDRTDVNAGNKGVLYALSLSVVPSVARNNVPFDDVDGLTISNTTGTVGAKATDAIYISNNTFAFGDKVTGTSEWYSIFTADNNADVGIQISGKMSTGKVARFPNATGVYFRDAADASDRQGIGITAGDVIEVGTGSARIDLKAAAIATAGLQVTGGMRANNGWLGTSSVVSAAATYTVLTTDNNLTFTGAGCTVTLPAAGSFNGRELTLRTTVNNAVISASSNVIPLAGGGAGTAILAATAGSWATLVSDGANWQTMRG